MPSQLGVPVVVSHRAPQLPQLDSDNSEVSQPSVSGGVVLQSAYPETHPLYVHAMPASETHFPPMLWVASQPVAPQTAQSVPEIGVSQPLVSGALVSQSA